MSALTDFITAYNELSYSDRVVFYNTVSNDVNVSEDHLQSFLIETRITDKRVCVYCSGEHVVKNGTRKDGTQRYLCRDCRKSFIPSSHSVTSRTKKHLSVWAKYLRCMMEKKTLAETAEECHIALSTNEIEDRTMQFLQVFLAGTRHRYVSHARVAHDVGLHAWVSSIGKHLRASATLSTECHILEVDALVIDTLLVLVHLLSPVYSTNHILVRRLIEFAVINTFLHLAQSNDEVAIRGEVVEHLFVWQRGVVASAVGKDEQRKWSLMLHGSKHVLRFIDYEARKCGFRNGFRFEWSATTLIYDFLGGCSDAGNG